MPAPRPLPFAAMLMLGIALCQPVAAAPVEVTFLPPAIPPQPVCVADKAQPDLAARWNAWDPATIPDGDPKDVIRDAKLLTALSASSNFELADKILIASAKMKTAKPLDITVDRVNLYLKAGKIPQLREAKLIEGLEEQSASLNSRGLNLLGDLYLRGVVVKKDEAKGLTYLTRAATAGNADALLRLASMNIAGKQVTGWQLDPKLAVTMAFGTLVGKLDPEICGRLERIAREYAKGEVVKQDHTISEKWLRLAADLGDPAAAWQVAQLHLESELIVKDNDALLKYLNMAADGGIGPAMVELGELYEAGALLPEDKQKAEALYSGAAKQGLRLGLLRLATLLESETGPDHVERYKKALIELSEAPQPPGWTYSKLAKVVLAEKGRWAGEAEAQALLEKGVALEDADSAQLLASILLRHRDEPGVFERATELLGLAVTGVGKIDPMTDLSEAYLCRAPKGVDLRMAGFWQDVEAAAGNSSEQLKPVEVRTLDAANDPLGVAQLQTHALYGRPNSVAYYMDYLRQNGASQEMLDFWQARVTPSPATLTAKARYDLQVSTDPAVVEEAYEAMKAAREAGMQHASLDLGSLLLDYYPNDEKKREEAIAYLDEAARQGIGEAILRLLPVLQNLGVGPVDLLQKYEKEIEERGDSDALIFAASTTNDTAKRRDYLYRAASVLDCTFENTIKLAGALVATEDSAETERWLQVSLKLVGSDGWRRVAIADRYMAMGGAERAKVAIALYEEGANLGDSSAIGRLVKIYSEPGSPDYAPTKAVAMFKRMVAQAPVTQLASIREKVQKAPPAIRTAVLEDVDWSSRYAAAAATGSPVAMRELALYLRSTGTPGDAKDASTWLQRAADGGDTVAMVELAKAYAMGIGIAPSIQQAQLLLKDAAGRGNEEAKQLLATMEN